MQAFREAKYDDATKHFEKAVSLDPENITTRLYLATSYGQQYIPGVDEPENVRMAESAIEQYEYVLNAPAVGDRRLNSAKGIAYLYLSMKKFEDSKKYDRMASDLDPKDPENYYSVGVIDWTLSYQPRMEARAKLDVKPEQPLDPTIPDQKKICDVLREKNMPVIEEGIDSLNKAIQLRPDYDDAMAYMNLQYREKADVECDDPTARKEDLATADHWLDRTLAVKKAKAEKNKHLPAPTAPSPQ